MGSRKIQTIAGLSTVLAGSVILLYVLRLDQSFDGVVGQVVAYDVKNDVSGRQSEHSLLEPSTDEERTSPDRSAHMEFSADSGDAISAKRMFEFGSSCYAYFRTKSRLDDGIISEMLDEPLPRSGLELRLFERELGEEQAELRSAGRVRSVCEAYGNIFSVEKMYELALRAAELGDGDAAICFASGAYGTPDDPALSESLSETYRENAPKFIERQFTRGDWRAILLYEKMYASEAITFGLSSHLREPNPKIALQYSRLRGMISDSVTRERIEESLVDEEKSFSAGEVESASRWASRMKQRYFASVNEVVFEGNVRLCEH